MEYTAGVTKAEFKPKTEYKVKAETRKFIKPSYIITALGIGRGCLPLRKLWSSS